MHRPPPATVAEAASELAGRMSGDTLVRPNEPLAKRATLRVGGPADVYIEPGSVADLKAAMSFCSERQLPVFVLGRGSNLLVKDGGFRGVIVCLSRVCWTRIEVAGVQLRCGAGAKLKAVAAEAKRNGVAGLEFLEGIPGSVGGGLRMNAGAMGGAIFDVVKSVRMMDFAGNICELSAAEMGARYRGCELLKDRIALEAVLAGTPEERSYIEERMAEFNRRRWSTQPAAPSAGCMFKNPPTIPAGRLIEELGLKGLRVGGAMVSLEHGNFLVNDGTATARDVLKLIELVRQRARAERGLELETEVEIIGDD